MPFRNVVDRYRLYCQAHGAESPEDMVRIEREWPDPKTRPISVIWIGRMWSEWCRETGVGYWARKTDEQHVEFDRWLERRVLGGE